MNAAEVMYLTLGIMVGALFANVYWTRWSSRMMETFYKTTTTLNNDWSTYSRELMYSWYKLCREIQDATRPSRAGGDRETEGLGDDDREYSGGGDR